jgi:hypothetical protein
MIRVLSVSLTIGLAVVSCDCFGGERTLEHMFDRDDPEAVAPVDFPLSELSLRLDASGHRHGAPLFGPQDVHVVMMDNACQEAWFQTSADATPALRIVGLEATDDCDESGTREELTRVFKEEFVLRLEGALPPLPYAGDPEGELYEYPDGSEPTLVLRKSLREARERFDASPFFMHEYHDGVYYLSPSACAGRFRVVEEPLGDSVSVHGVGYVKPCTWGDDQACLARLFSIALGVPEQASPAPTRCRSPGDD